MGHSQTIGTNSTAFEMRGHSPSPSFSCGRSKQQSQDLMAAIRVVEEHPQTDNALNCALAQAIRYIYFEDEQTTAYIKSKFEALRRHKKNTMYTHVTCATDKS